MLACAASRWVRRGLTPIPQKQMAYTDIVQAIEFIGADETNRTSDLLITNAQVILELLY